MPPEAMSLRMRYGPRPVPCGSVGRVSTARSFGCTTEFIATSCARVWGTCSLIHSRMERCSAGCRMFPAWLQFCAERERRRVGELVVPRPRLPLVEVHLAGVLHVVEEGVAQLLGQLGVGEADGDLVVALEGAVV